MIPKILIIEDGKIKWDTLMIAKKYSSIIDNNDYVELVNDLKDTIIIKPNMK